MRIVRSAISSRARGAFLGAALLLPSVLFFTAPVAGSRQTAEVAQFSVPTEGWETAGISAPIEHVPVRNFGVVDPGCLYRSAQPSEIGYAWLKAHGLKSVVCLRSEYDEGAQRMAGLGFNYLYLPIENERAPSDQQARKFLEFVRDPKHWPVLVHCKDGIGRAGTLAALARYSIDGWSMSNALEEAKNYRPFHFRMFGEQRRWLNGWKDRFALGEYHPSKEMPNWPEVAVRPTVTGG